MNYPRLLILSNNSFSKQNSNGRTLGSLLHGWPKDRLAQFCISSDGADFDVCNNYYCVTDGDVLRSAARLKPAKRRNLLDAKKIDANSVNGHVKHRKTSLKMFARNFGWELGIWKGKEFYQWVDASAPDIILLQSGETYFMHKLAMKLAKRTGAQLAIFNTEASYFFKRDFFAKDGVIGRQLFKLYQIVYRHYFAKFMGACSKEIYGNELLRLDYDRAFDKTNSLTIYTSSFITSEPPLPIKKSPVFSYLGNMGFNRPEALIEFSEVLMSINPEYKLDVYGFAKNEAMETLLNEAPGIRFHGAVPYSDVLKVMAVSDFLIHVESQCEEWRESLRYGFSTKIADSIASGKTFILYASEDIACAQYIKNNGAGIFAATKESLRNQIIEILECPEKRQDIFLRAKTVAKENHNPKRNTEIFLEYLIS